MHFDEVFNHLLLHFIILDSHQYVVRANLKQMFSLISHIMFL